MKKYLFISILWLFRAVDVQGQDTTRLSLLFLGDIMQHDSQILDAYDSATGHYDYEPCFRHVKPYTQSVDLAIGNLEVTLGGTPYKGYPRFSAPDELMVALKDMGMDVLVTANNHCVDRGREGLERTIHMLDSFNILHTGTFVDEVSKLNDHPLIIEKHGFVLALLNYTYGTNGLPVTSPSIVNLIDTAVVRADLEKARASKADAIIVFMHWGAEYKQLPGQSQKDLTEICFSQGATMVIGAHPHVLQPIEWRKESSQLVAYSLGNFVSGQRTRNRDGGAMLIVEMEKTTGPGDSSAVTRIDSASYVLEWVYRDAQRNYFVLPVPAFEKGKTGQQKAFETFVSDSRGLFSAHNKGIRESLHTPPDSVVTYRVWFATLNRSPDGDTSIPRVPYGLTTETDDSGNTMCFSGDFLKRRDAERYAGRLTVEFGYADARVVQYVNGARMP